MSKVVIRELLDLQKRLGIEPYMTDEGWLEYFRILVQMENEEENEVTEKSA